MKNLQHEAQKIRLSVAEKAAMKARIFGAPSPVQPTRSPYVFFSIFSYHTRMVLAGLLLFVLVGTGTASAAQGSLPGDLLYPVKISVNERVEAALAPTVAAKAQVQVAQASRRVEEAQVLAQQGRLDATTTATLADNFDEHAQEAQDLAQKAEGDDPGAVAEVKAQLSSSLLAQGAILAKLGDESNNKANRDHSRAFAARIIARAGASDRSAVTPSIAMASAPAEVSTQSSAKVALQVSALSAPATTSASAESEGKFAGDTHEGGSSQGALNLGEKATQQIADARAQFEQVKPSLDATTTVRVQTQLDLADKALGRGVAQVQSGAYADAQASFARALGISARLSALLGAQQKFDKGILKALIRSDGDKAEEDATIRVELHQ